jgi:uncharacterized protein YdaU (DUF1376 family)
VGQDLEEHRAIRSRGAREIHRGAIAGRGHSCRDRVAPLVVSRSPAFQFYASDFVGSATVGASSAEEVGIYVLLLSKDWMETGFAFDEARLARWCKVSVPVFRAAWLHLGPKFPARDVDGVARHFNPRLEAERGKQAAYRATQAAKGVASGQSRRNRSSTGVEPGLNRGSTGAEPGTNSPSPSPASASTSRARAGNRNGDRPTYAPGHVTLPEPLLCQHCNATTDDSGKRVRVVHEPHCPAIAEVMA